MEEDGAYPSEPPPPNADPSYKKQRVIIAAVKQSGRVFLHKARENDDRTFQIGKTWPLEELTVIESFSGKIQRSPQDQTRARLGGDIGFVITIAKPYFWKAKTAKEKAFFIGSIVKIYRKYTNGRLPKLVGFDAEEEHQILALSEGPPQQQRPPPPAQTGPPPQPPGPNLAPGPPPPMPYAQRPPGSDSSLPSQASGPRRHRPSDANGDTKGRSPSAASSGRQRPPSPNALRDEVPPLQPHQYGGPPPGATPSSRSATPKLRNVPSHESYAKSRSSQEQLRSKTPEAPFRMGHQQSRSNFSSPAPPEDRFDYRVPSSRYGSQAPQLPQEDIPRSPGLLASPQDSFPVTNSISSTTADRWRPPGVPHRERTHTPNESLASNLSGPSHPSFMSDRATGNALHPTIPERRRPTLGENSFGGPRDTPNAIEEESMPKPLLPKKSAAQEPSARPKLEETPSQIDARIPGGFRTPSPAPTPPPPLKTDLSPPKTTNVLPTANDQGRKSEESKPARGPSPPLVRTPTPPQPAAAARTATPEPSDVKDPPGSPTVGKPALGDLMGKKLLGGKTMNNNWKKATQAASFASAFKPRAGGAGARLLANKNQQAGDEPDGTNAVVPAPGLKPAVEDNVVEPPSEPQKEEKPGVQVIGASPTTDDPMARSQNNFLSKDPGSPVLTQKAQPQLAYQYNNALNALGIDHAVLGGQGQEFEATLTEFGWSSNILQNKTIDTMEMDLRKEIARLEAGPWLGQETEDGGHKDAGVEGFEKVLDKAIAECDEMERLLSLYGVELAVSPRLLHYKLTTMLT